MGLFFAVLVKVSSNSTYIFLFIWANLSRVILRLCNTFLFYLPVVGCLQTAFILLANNTDLLVGTSASASLASASSRHVYITNHPQPSVNPLAVADQWFSELNVDMEKVNFL